jgi:hypothetical protein
MTTALTTTTPGAIVHQSLFDAIDALVLDTVSERTL